MASDEPADAPKPPQQPAKADAPPDDVGPAAVVQAEIGGGDGATVEPAAETEIWAGRTHWKHYAGRLTAWAVGNVVAGVAVGWIASRVEWLAFRGAFWTIAGIVVVSGAFVVGRIALKILGHRYRLTSQRLFISRGILSQTVDQTELIRVDDVRIHKTLLDRIFGLGSIAILSTDASDRAITIEGIVDPEHVAEAIRTHMRTMRKKSLFVENL